MNRKKEHSGRLYSSLPSLSGHKVWAEIDTGALTHNYKLLCSHIGSEVRKLCVVKADAYGHGSDECVRALAGAGCDFFAVSGIDEAISVRRCCERDGVCADILILGYTLPSQAALLSENNITQAILSLEYARDLSDMASAAGVSVKCHIAIDSGMNRIGICARREDELGSALSEILQIMALPSLEAVGMFSHFSSADEDTRVTEAQYSLFCRMVSGLESVGKRPQLCHICNSAGASLGSKYHSDGVRLGIMLYGVPISDGFREELLPVMRLKTVISHVHKLSSGQRVSYGGEYFAEGERVIATLPIGYADGFLRAYTGACVRVLTEAGEVDCPIIGRICMDQCMVDISGTNAKVGDDVLLFGDREGKMLASLAERAGTIEYECLCLVSARVPRIYKDDRLT